MLGTNLDVGCIANLCKTEKCIVCVCVFYMYFIDVCVYVFEYKLYYLTLLTSKVLTSVLQFL